MSAEKPTQIHARGEATGFIPEPGDKGKPITVIGTKQKNRRDCRLNGYRV